MNREDTVIGRMLTKAGILGFAGLRLNGADVTPADKRLPVIITARIDGDLMVMNATPNPSFLLERDGIAEIVLFSADGELIVSMEPMALGSGDTILLKKAFDPQPGAMERGAGLEPA